jgi:hypothetical protein
LEGLQPRAVSRRIIEALGAGTPVRTAHDKRVRSTPGFHSRKPARPTPAKCHHAAYRQQTAKLA